MTVIRDRVEDVFATLERRGTKRTRDGYARYGITVTKAFGVPVATIQQIAKGIGRDHELALALWDTGWYEARMLTAFIDEPVRVTAAQMDRWARDFDNWAICDTLCFHLFDRTQHAWPKVTQWSTRRGEFVKRGAFALLASLSLHDKTSPDKPFLQGLRIVEREATDARNFVRKAVSWALRTTGRRNKALNAASVETARRLVESPDAAALSTGKEALRELTSPAVLKKLERARR